MSVGTIIPSPSRIDHRSAAPVQRLDLAWTAGSSQGVIGLTPMVNGSILRVEFVPDPTDVPTAAYDVTLTDVSGIDVLAGGGANLSATVPATIIPTVGDTGLPFVVAEPLTLTVANAGAGKKGKVVVYVRP